jgi:hypothetical protein
VGLFAELAQAQLPCCCQQATFLFLLLLFFASPLHCLAASATSECPFLPPTMSSSPDGGGGGGDFPDQVKLCVKIFNPNVRGECQQVDLHVPPGTTVLAVKEAVADRLDGDAGGGGGGRGDDGNGRYWRPSVQQMRLIYSGKLLVNGTRLSQVLRKPALEDSADDDGEASYTLQAVLPLEQSTKDKYSHEVRERRQKGVVDGDAQKCRASGLVGVCSGCACSLQWCCCSSRPQPRRLHHQHL